MAIAVNERLSKRAWRSAPPLQKAILAGITVRSSNMQHFANDW
jgi:hypothetical protein